MMRQVAVVAFVALLAVGKFASLNAHWQVTAADQGGGTGDDSGDDTDDGA